MEVVPGETSSDDILYNLLNQINNNLVTKIDNINFELKILKKKTNEAKILKEKIDFLENENEQLSAHVEKLERSSKSENLILYGISENSQENNAELLRIATNLLKDQLNIEITAFDITNIYRLGKNSSRIRPVLVTFHSKLKRQETLLNAAKFKNTGIYVSEDLTNSELIERKTLVEYFKQAKIEKKEAKLRRNKLIIIEGKVYTYTKIYKI
ncbi:hypothetical protein NQ317_000989 [Molorchus minor]|uniref:Uncharacterized protein n=1 Tax=Molorchus minor TaxID=1323400 RepID=A0ABQ9JQ61_9CUCU|nr:hypothetical protein NQ317_000989 [Molorchus minor]